MGYQITQISKDELDNILKLHKEWSESGGKSGERADLSGADLSGADLREADLSGAKLNGANLIEANLTGANFSGANLRGADLRGAYLRGAKLSGADLCEADLSGAKLSGANLSGADLCEAKLSGADLKGADLREADLKEADLREADLKSADFKSADLREANLLRANLWRANLLRANLGKVNLMGGYLMGADLREANLNKADLREANLNKADLREANLNKAVLSITDLSEVDLDKVEWGNIDLFDYIKIDKNTAEQIPEEIRKRFQNTWYILNPDFDENSITRSIEFPPEYHQAGVSILNYFATVLRKKHPDMKAKVKIEQEGLKVTMIIESLEGKKEIIEKTLDDYNLVLKDAIPVEKFYDNPADVIELKNQLGIARLHVETQKNIIESLNVSNKAKDVRIDRMLDIIEKGIEGPKEVHMHQENNPTIITKVSLELNQKISSTLDTLDQFKALHEDWSETAREVEEIKESLGKLEGKSQEEVYQSPVMGTFKKFLENLDKTGFILGKTEKVINIAKKLAMCYNAIALYCGLFPIPSIFVK
ncbi:MAG: pentapeptide repeat-containing protein [bacterium]|nr:pentapeptide repeat-containing protein [bacterium]